MISRKALVAATFLTLPLAARAEPIDGLYIGAGVGWNYLESVQIKNFSGQRNLFGGISVPNKNANFGSGVMTRAYVGWGFGNGLRAELEGNYASNSANQTGSPPAFPGLVSVNNNGGESKGGVMVNALYDFNGVLNSVAPGLTPYVGAGVGWQYIRLSSLDLVGALPAGPNTGAPFLFRINNGQNTFAYQFIAGVSYDLTSITPGLAATAEYRFLGTAGDRTYKAQFFAPRVARGTNFTLGNEYNHAIILGLRYAFNVAPPPPPPVTPAPAPVAQPTRTYLVFFDWDKHDLTERARQIIAEAAQASTRVQVTRIEVDGYTDLSGSAKYNQGLSERRANAVRAELERDSVPSNIIETRGFGESNPLVPTAQGVREPQNRRVEIILR